MKKHEADEIFSQIEQLASKVEHDEELKQIDERYSVTASWVDVDITNTSL